MTGKKERPVTEPIYSGGNLNDFPISSGYDVINYTEFISSYMFNSERIVTSQSMHNGNFSACFATTILYKPRPLLTWWICRNYGSFLTFVKAQWENSRRIYSLACDERFGFGVFLMENFGTNQAIITNTSDIQRFGKDGFRITALAARGSTSYVIMTKGTKEYGAKSQEWITGNTWLEVDTEIRKSYQTGKVITGICYSTGLEQYFVVMTEMPHGQCYAWQTDNTKEGYFKREKWVKKKSEEGYHLTIIFNDPTDDKILFVMTKDGNISEYTYKINHKMKS